MKKKNEKAAFSLIETMIIFVAVTVAIAALTPSISRKLANFVDSNVPTTDDEPTYGPRGVPSSEKDCAPGEVCCDPTDPTCGKITTPGGSHGRYEVFTKEIISFDNQQNYEKVPNPKSKVKITVYEKVEEKYDSNGALSSVKYKEYNDATVKQNFDGSATEAQVKIDGKNKTVKRSSIWIFEDSSITYQQVDSNYTNPKPINNDYRIIESRLTHHSGDDGKGHNYWILKNKPSKLVKVPWERLYGESDKPQLDRRLKNTSGGYCKLGEQCVTTFVLPDKAKDLVVHAVGGGGAGGGPSTTLNDANSIVGTKAAASGILTNNVDGHEYSIDAAKKYLAARYGTQTDKVCVVHVSPAYKTDAAEHIAFLTLKHDPAMFECPITIIPEAQRIIVKLRLGEASNAFPHQVLEYTKILGSPTQKSIKYPIPEFGSLQNIKDAGFYAVAFAHACNGGDSSKELHWLTTSEQRDNTLGSNWYTKYRIKNQDTGNCCNKYCTKTKHVCTVASSNLWTGSHTKCGSCPSTLPESWVNSSITRTDRNLNSKINTFAKGGTGGYAGLAVDLSTNPAIRVKQLDDTHPSTIYQSDECTNGKNANDTISVSPAIASGKQPVNCGGGDAASGYSDNGGTRSCLIKDKLCITGYGGTGATCGQRQVSGPGTGFQYNLANFRNYQLSAKIKGTSCGLLAGAKYCMGGSNYFDFSSDFFNNGQGGVDVRNIYEKTGSAGEPGYFTTILDGTNNPNSYRKTDSGTNYLAEDRECYISLDYSYKDKTNETKCVGSDDPTTNGCQYEPSLNNDIVSNDEKCGADFVNTRAAMFRLESDNSGPKIYSKGVDYSNPNKKFYNEEFSWTYPFAIKWLGYGNAGSPGEYATTKISSSPKAGTHLVVTLGKAGSNEFFEKNRDTMLSKITGIVDSDADITSLIGFANTNNDGKNGSATIVSLKGPGFAKISEILVAKGGQGGKGNMKTDQYVPCYSGDSSEYYKYKDDSRGNPAPVVKCGDGTIDCCKANDVKSTNDIMTTAPRNSKFDQIKFTVKNSSVVGIGLGRSGAGIGTIGRTRNIERETLDGAALLFNSSEGSRNYLNPSKPFDLIVRDRDKNFTERISSTISNIADYKELSTPNSYLVPGAFSLSAGDGAVIITW